MGNGAAIELKHNGNSFTSKAKAYQHCQSLVRNGHYERNFQDYKESFKEAVTNDALVGVLFSPNYSLLLTSLSLLPPPVLISPTNTY